MFPYHSLKWSPYEAPAVLGSIICLSRAWLPSASNETMFSNHSFKAQGSVLFQAMGLAFCLSFSELHSTLPVLQELKLGHQPTPHGVIEACWVGPWPLLFCGHSPLPQVDVLEFFHLTDNELWSTWPENTERKTKFCPLKCSLDRRILQLHELCWVQHWWCIWERSWHRDEGMVTGWGPERLSSSLYGFVWRIEWD